MYFQWAWVALFILYIHKYIKIHNVPLISLNVVSNYLLVLFKVSYITYNSSTPALRFNRNVWFMNELILSNKLDELVNKSHWKIQSKNRTDPDWLQLFFSQLTDSMIQSKWAMILSELEHVRDCFKRTSCLSPLICLNVDMYAFVCHHLYSDFSCDVFV